MEATVDRKARELRDDVLRAVSRFIERRSDVGWERILEAILEAAEIDLSGRAKAEALIEVAQ